MEDPISSPCKPVFVVGMNGSGTSMMQDSLGRHPDLYAMPDETLMMPYIIMRADKFGNLAVAENFREYWQFAIDELPALARFNKGTKPKIPANWDTFPRTVEGVFDGIFSGLAANHGKRRWCEKTPDHVQHIPLLASTFPRARFIHLIRDGREVARSVNRRQLRTPQLVIYRWKKLVGLGRAEGRKLGARYMELRYEDLTSNPKQEMARVCAFLEIENSEAVLQSRMPQSPKRKQMTPGELGAITKNPAKWGSYFDTSTVGRLEAIGGRTLSDLGYPVSDAAGDSDPGHLTRRWWRLTDFSRITLKRIKTRSSYRSWRSLSRKIYFSFKQYGTKKF